MMKIRKALALFLALALACGALCVPAGAVDSSQTFAFTLTADADGTLQIGDEVTVTLTLSRTDREESWAMYAWQTEIAYDNTVFALVEDSVTAASGVGTSVHTVGDVGKIYFNDYSVRKAGDEYPAQLTVGSFTLRVIGGAGSGVVQNTNYLVSTAGGTDHYQVESRDVSLTIQGGTRFADVAADAWYASAVDYVTSAGLFQGVSATSFAPEAAMTRSMLVTVLYRLEGEPETAETADFSDVSQGQWYSAAVAWANGNGIVGGYGDGRFGPDDNVTREQMAAILYRFVQHLGLDDSARGSLSHFSDGGDTSAWAVEAMQWAVGAGILQGDETGALKPLGAASRAEVAAMLMRFVQTFYES